MALSTQQAVVSSSLKLSRPVATAAAAQQTSCSLSSSAAAGLKSRGLALTAAAPAPLATSWWRDLASALPSASSSCSASRRSFAVRADASEGESSATAVAEEEVEVAEVDDSAADAPTKTVTQVKDIMNILTQQSAQTLRAERGLPNLRPGDVIAMKVEVPENKRRVSLVRGIVIARHNAGINSTFRIRRIMAGVGVEMVFPLFSPNIKEIKVVDKRRARRAKLYYLRDKIARLSTVN